jgi:putative oxidoreductase
MRSRIFLMELIRALLILLFVYAAVSKLVDYDHSRGQMLNQVFPRRLAEVLVWSVPLTELATTGLLLFKRTFLTGLYFALGLMTVFTIYIGLVLLHFFTRVPCSCGGVLQKMGWVPHLWFNLFFLLLTAMSIYTFYRERRIAGNRLM